MKPHKHAELIKLWADGAEIERLSKIDGTWYSLYEPEWDEDYEYRIKPEVAQWRKDMAQALKDGKQVMCRVWWTNGVPEPTKYKASAFLDPAVKLMESDYFIKPETKPDVIKYLYKKSNGDWGVLDLPCKHLSMQVAVAFDGETGEPKSAEVLK